MRVYFGAGGFSGFWYNLGVAMRFKDNTNITFEGTSSGSLVAWVMCFDKVDFEMCKSLAIKTKQHGVFSMAFPGTWTNLQNS